MIDFANRAQIYKANIIFENVQSNNGHLKKLEAITIQGAKDAQEINSLKNEVEIQLSELKNTIDTYKETSKLETSKLEVRTNALAFERAANDYNERSKNWKISLFVLVGVLIITSICFIVYFNDVSYEPSVILSATQKNTLFYFILFKNITLRIFILSILIYLLKFCNKNYNALKHNSTINRHKANCLEAAIRIISLMPSDDNTESILNLASKEIFTHHRTGYLFKDENVDLSLIEKIISISGIEKK